MAIFEAIRDQTNYNSLYRRYIYQYRHDQGNTWFWWKITIPMSSKSPKTRRFYRDLITETADFCPRFLEKIVVKSFKTALVHLIFTMIQMMVVFEFMSTSRRVYHRLLPSCSSMILMNEKGDDFILPISSKHTKKAFF